MQHLLGKKSQQLQQSYKQMLKRLKKTIFSSECEKFLQKNHIDKTHEFISLRALAQVVEYMHNPNSKRQMIHSLSQRLKTNDMTLKLKTLVVIHACLRNQFHQQLCEIILDQPTLEEKNSSQMEKQRSLKSFLQMKKELQVVHFMKYHVVEFYLSYLKKICMHQDSYLFVKKYKMTHQDGTLILISEGFKIINLVTYVLKSQDTFNKLGRYYIHFQQAFNAFLMLLHDLDLYNLYIKRTVKKVMEETNKNEKNLEKVQVDEREKEQTKHFFLYLNEAQKISDRLYQFYYNRYYYKKTKVMVTFPTFLTIDNNEYNRVRSRTKSVDRKLVKMVKMSKYERKGQRSLPHKTEPNLQSTFSCSLSNNRKELTMPRELTSLGPYQKMSFDFRDDYEGSKKNQQYLIEKQDSYFE